MSNALPAQSPYVVYTLDGQLLMQYPLKDEEKEDGKSVVRYSPIMAQVLKHGGNVLIV